MTANTEQVIVSTLGIRVPFADPIYSAIMDFVNDEAALLDRDLQHEWLELVAEDLAYTIPWRQTLQRSDGSGIDMEGGMPASKAGMEILVRRNVDVERGYDRDPPPRIRRFVTNVKAYRTDVENEYSVESNLLLLRSQHEEPTYDFLSAERRDVLRDTEAGLKLVRRRVLCDSTVLGSAFPDVIL